MVQRQRAPEKLFLHGLRQRPVDGIRPGEWAVLALAGLVSWQSAPAMARAEGCSPLDLTPCVNAAQYAFWNGWAIFLWSINRVLLTVAYQLDVFRAWLVNTVFTSVFKTIAETISPALAPMATIAVLIGVVCFLLLPVIGRIEIVNIRRALVWIVAAPLLLGIAGQGLAGAEQFRTTMGQTMFSAAQTVGSTPQFGAQSDEMNNAAAKLYPFNGCDGGALTRPFTDGGSDGLYMDDLAASLMYANAQDIHCPNKQGPSNDLPDAFFSSPPGYATTEDVSRQDAATSAAWAGAMQRGVTRLAMGLVPSLLAVMNAIIQLLFALALVLLFVALPLGLLIVFFTDTAAGVTGLVRRGVNTLQTSWSSSLILGVVFAALLAAARLGNVAAFVGLSLAGIFLTLFIIGIAISAFMLSVRAIAQTVSMGTGIGAGAAGLAVGGVAGAVVGGLAATTAAGKAGLSYQVARKAGASRTYALGTAAGRNRAVATVGELAATLGKNTELSDGIYTGQRAARNRDGARMILQRAGADAEKTYGGGISMGQREEERKLQRAADRAKRGSNLEQGGRMLGGAIGSATHPVQTVKTGYDRAVELGGDAWRAAWEQTRERGQTAKDSVVARVGDTPTVARMAGAVASAASNRFVRDGRSGRLVKNTRGGVDFLPRLSEAELPAWALREPAATINEGRLLQLGHQLQYNRDGSATFWHPAGPDAVQDNNQQATARQGKRPAAPPTPTARPTVTAAPTAPGMQPHFLAPTSPNATRSSAPPASPPPAAPSGSPAAGPAPASSRATPPAPSGTPALASAGQRPGAAAAQPLSAPPAPRAGGSRIYPAPSATPAAPSATPAAPTPQAPPAPAATPGGAGAGGTTAPTRIPVAAHTRARPQPAGASTGGSAPPSPAGAPPGPPATPQPPSTPAGGPGAPPSSAQPPATGPTDPITPPPTPGLWRRQVRRARIEQTRGKRIQVAYGELTRARTRLTLVQAGAVVGSAATAEQAAQAAEQRVAAVERPRMPRPALSPRGAPALQPRQKRAALQRRQLRRGQTWRYQPGAPLPAGVASPARVMVRAAGERNAAVAVDQAGYATPRPQVVPPPPDRRLDLLLAEVRDLDRLLQAGYQVYQAPGSDRVLLWPKPDAPGVHWVDVGTPKARPDLVRERRRLGQQGVLAPLAAARPAGADRLWRAGAPRPRGAPGRRRARPKVSKRTRP